MTMLRKIAGVLGGVFAAGLVIGGVEASGHSLAAGEAVLSRAMASARWRARQCARRWRGEG